jgi:hypothetical protein
MSMSDVTTSSTGQHIYYMTKMDKQDKVTAKLTGLYDNVVTCSRSCYLQGYITLHVHTGSMFHETY